MAVPGRFGYWLWLWGIGYSLAELALGGLAVLMAVRSIRKLRARLTHGNSAPPRWVRDRYRREDKLKAQQEQAREALELQKRSQREWADSQPDHLLPVALLVAVMFETEAGAVTKRSPA